MNMPSIGLGTFRLKDQIVIDSVSQGLEVGYRHIDTAQIYGNETQVGQAIAASQIDRTELFLTTKIWTENLKREKLIPSLKTSLSKLGVDQLDLTLIHWPVAAETLSVADYVSALAEAKAQGLTREIGVSNFTVDQMQQAVAAVGKGQIITNQIELHPFLQNHKVVAAARELGIQITAYMPLAYGKVIDDPVLQQIAAAHATTPAQVSLAWLLQQGYTVIPSSTKRANLISNLQAGAISLTHDEMQQIAALGRGERLVDPDFAPAWD